ncbi:general negative regulator of transcription subunit 5 [[Candida] jaroonii]|uniref:General negative regulator of transcription subunit 5 n=1 Tax=[Candida] jaroonii TaxID=467808 RepID=A0ACA9Y6J2_9ASCO|nr:general negative regulator of transcription subunit 5 [[Candida] jaroonii]
MSNRKLQQEFDKTNKKIAEGLSLFDDVYEKALTTELSSQRDKFEGDLKKEIKKLQRLRDQLKQWLSDTSIKLDKNLLSENRGKIENAMDRFKDLEKISKIKQFSNEGLELSSKKKLPRFGDANEEKKEEAFNYISDIRDQLASQSELLESDVHHYTTQLKKAKASNSYTLTNQIEDAKAKIERNVFHLTQLEKILRSLENEELKPEEVDKIKDDLEYYVENNQEDEEGVYDDFYDVLDLRDDLDVHGSLAREKEEQDRKDAEQAELEAQEKAEKEKLAKEKEEAEKAEKERLEKERLAKEKEEKEKKRKVSTAKTVEIPNAYASGTTIAEAVSASIGAAPSAPSIAAASTVAAAASTAAIVAATATNGNISSNNSSSAINTPSLSNTSLSSPSKLPPGLSNIQRSSDTETFIDSIPKLSQLSQSRLSNPLPFRSISTLLDQSLFNSPDSFDAERPREYNPLNVHPSSIDYPQEPMYELNSSNIVAKFDNDTLFYCFYYGNNLSKYNASKELIKRGWLYNTNLNQWILRDDKSNDFKYFDYEKAWLTRRKEIQFNPSHIESFI